MAITYISLNTPSVTGGTVWEAAEPSWTGASLQGAGNCRKVLGCVFSTGSSLPWPLTCVGVSKLSFSFLFSMLRVSERWILLIQVLSLPGHFLMRSSVCFSVHSVLPHSTSIPFPRSELNDRHYPSESIHKLLITYTYLDFINSFTWTIININEKSFFFSPSNLRYSLENFYLASI